MIAGLKNRHILVVDDNQDTLDLLTAALELEGATVSAVNSAIDAINLLNQCRPNLLLCDLAMPNIDGFMLLKQIRSSACSQSNQLPAIAMTAMYGGHYQQQAIDAGFELYFEKPVDLDQLIRAIQSLLPQKRDRRVQRLSSRLNLRIQIIPGIGVKPLIVKTLRISAGLPRLQPTCP